MEHEIPRMVPVFAGIFVLFMVLVSLIVTGLITWAYCRIFSKAGYCWALGLLMLVPIANIIMPFFLAFADWPLRKELRQLKQKQEKSSA